MSFIEEEQFIADRKILVGIPAYDGRLHVDLCKSLFDFQRELARYGASFGIVSCLGNALVTEARNEIIQEFFEKTDGTDLFFIDSDVVFSVEDAMRIIIWSTKYDVVSGCYPRKQVDKDGLPMFDCTPVLDENEYLQFDEEGYLFKHQGCGIGFTNIRRNVVERLMELSKDDWYMTRKNEKRIRIFDLDLINNVLIGEDYYFFRKILAAGFDCWADPSCNLKHVGSHTYTGSMREVLEKRMGERQEKA